MSGMHRDFLRRASRIPFFGLGLAVDVYSPDVFELCEELSNRQISISYLEIFQAAPEALEIIRGRFPDISLAYHAEGLWFSLPDWETAYHAQERLTAAARDLRILQAFWVNQECAAKEIAGFAFGTYIPPLFTEASAEVTAYHTWKAQQWLDRYDWGSPGEAPLFLLEGPPLSYFLIGDMSYAEFFAKVTDLAPCGLVLDLGHVWTVYRYTGAWRTKSLKEFCEKFFEEFPLERVIQIHIAGLECHPTIPHLKNLKQRRQPPAWIDAHEAPIPEELLEVLAQVVQEPRLTSLKGIALEVDNKRIDLICEEINKVREILEPVVHSRDRESASARELQGEKDPRSGEFDLARETWQRLNRQYREYVELVTGKGENRHDLLQKYDEGMGEGLSCYTTQYLPNEILSWGGDVRVMFPKECQLLDQHKISLNQFVEFWFAHSRPSELEYDFFILKLQLFVEFLGQVLPNAVPTAEQEAALLSLGYVKTCHNLQS